MITVRLGMISEEEEGEVKDDKMGPPEGGITNASRWMSI